MINNYYVNEDEIIKSIRQSLIINSELDSKQILNAESVGGIDLVKYINEYQQESLSLSNLILLFNIDRDNDNLNMSEEDNGKIRSVESFSCLITIYGDDSSSLSNLLKLRLLSNGNREYLLDNHIHLIRISNITEMSEYINETYWNRQDFTIYFEVEKIYDRVIIPQKIEML